MKFATLLKRSALLLLACVMLLTACTGSTDPETSESGKESAAESDSGERKYTLISVGKPYQTLLQASDSYSDLFGVQLTDGQKVPDSGSFYRDIRMVGFTGNARFDIDLGEDGKRISAIQARSLDSTKDGVRLAGGIRIFGSNDGQEWTGIGRAFFHPTGEMTVSTARYEPKELLDYRYIRINITMQSGANFFFTDELEIFADVPEKSATSTLEASYGNESIDRNAWKKVSTGKKAEPVLMENVARGMKYSFLNATADPRAKEAYDIAKLMPRNTVKPAFDEMLTDGARTGQMFGERVWNGIRATGTPSLKLDLGKVHSDLFSFRLHMLGNGSDVELPDYVDVYGSDDDKNYTLLGRMYAPLSADNYAFTLMLPEYVHARYVRFDFPTGKTNYWMEEIEVYAGRDSQPDEELYPIVSFPKVTEELRWDSSEPDYRKEQNLILGKTQQVAVSYYMDPARANDEHPETPWNTTILTDGQRAPDSYCYSSGWFLHRGGGAIEFFYDLEKLSTVNSVNVSYLEQLAWGINHPNYISILLSEDANNWYSVKTEHYTEQASNDAHRVTAEIKLDRPYAARFVRIRVESAVLFIDELEVMGTKQVANSATRLANSGVESVPYYTNEEDSAWADVTNTPIKAKDIALVYGNQGTDKDLLALAAYVDQEGNILDTLMDGFLYCPTGGVPSGSPAHLYSIKSDWDYMMDQTFNGQTGFDTLNTVIGTVKEALDKPEYKVQVYITILSPGLSVTEFGDVDGDGVTESTETTEGRRKVLDWYISSCMSLFEERAYENLELGGFYWLSESVAYETDDSHLIREVADAVHSAGSYFLWIPYYNAHRYFQGYELGFDLVCMQPNYAFTLDKTLSNFTSTNRRMKINGMCIEIENSYQSLADPLYARNYMLYLYYGATTGYMKDAVHIYYDDVNNYSTMAYSDSALCRMQYDATYKFIRGTLEITPDKRDAIAVSGKKNTLLTGTVSQGDGLELFTLVKAPEHGYIALSENGDFVYYPDKGYTGTDSFSYTYNRYLGESAPCSVTLTVN